MRTSSFLMWWVTFWHWSINPRDYYPLNNHSCSSDWGFISSFAATPNFFCHHYTNKCQRSLYLQGCWIIVGEEEGAANIANKESSSIKYVIGYAWATTNISEPGFSVANDPSNDPISQKIAKNVVSEKPDWNVWWKDLFTDHFIGKISVERSFYRGKIIWNDLIGARSFLSRLKDRFGLKNLAQVGRTELAKNVCSRLRDSASLSGAKSRNLGQLFWPALYTGLSKHLKRAAATLPLNSILGSQVQRNLDGPVSYEILQDNWLALFWQSSDVGLKRVRRPSSAIARFSSS